MSEPQVGVENSYAITPVEQAVAVVPWRYAETVWQPLEDQLQGRIHWLAGLLAWALVLALGGLSGVVVWQFIPLPMDGHLEGIAAGQVLVQDNKDAPWFAADEGRFIRQGARLRAEPGTVALVQFDDGSRLRIETEGEWLCMRLAQSRNTRLKRVRIRQVDGQASYAAAPLQPGVDATIKVDMPDVQLLLRGVATVALAPDQGGQMTLWQGTGEVRAYDQRLVAQGGDQLVHSIAQRQVVHIEGAVSR